MRSRALRWADGRRGSHERIEYSIGARMNDLYNCMATLGLSPHVPLCVLAFRPLSSTSL